MLIVFFLSIWMVIDRDQILSFLFRLVPPSHADDARLLQVSVGRSFGGFLRGQGAMGGLYFLVALATSAILGLPLAILTSVVAGVLMAIPFFGPFVAWAPPVVVALFFVPGALVAVDGASMCEWKGQAAYADLVGGGVRAERAAWTYPEPTPRFTDLRDFWAVTTLSVESCWVDGERVQPQEGGFYGGWVTSKVVGPFKGIPGSWGW